MRPPTLRFTVTTTLVLGTLLTCGSQALADSAGRFKQAPLVDLSTLTQPGGLGDPGVLNEALQGGPLDLGDLTDPNRNGGPKALIDFGNLGELADVRKLGRAKGLGTGKPGPDDPTREYELAARTPLPVLPESVAFDERTQTFFVSSFGTGAIFRGSLGEDEAEQFLAPHLGRLMALGVEVDDEGRLYVLTGPTGRLEVYDIDSAKRIATFKTGLGGILQDVVVAPGGDVYVSDALRPTLFRIRAEAIDVGGGKVERIELGPEVQYTLTPQVNGMVNGNGIVAAGPNELIVAQTNTNELFRVVTGEDPDDVDVDEIDVRGTFDNFDGLELLGDTLYGVDNLNNEVVGIDLSDDLLSGRVVSRTSDDTFAQTTGVASTGDRLLITNSQIFMLPMMEPWTVSSIRMPARSR